MEKNFVQADSGNLPKVDALMVARFFSKNPDFYAAELRNVKTAMSARESYGDDAIGYVQLHRELGICTIKCKMCPEHKVRNKGYAITLTVDENDELIKSCECHDCAASAGGCKHAVAFLMWVHRRSEEPACTSVECYWRKSTLSRVGTTMKHIKVVQLCKKEVPHRPGSAESTGLLTEFLSESKSRKITNCELLRYQNDFQYTGVTQYSLHHFIMGQSSDIVHDVNKLMEAMKQKFNQMVIQNIEEATRLQSKSNLWYELRYGRITASKAHEVSVCQTNDGTLVAAIMGAKIPDTAAMKRGRNLEISVRQTVAKKLKQKFTNCGLFVSKEYPMIAASPDGIAKDAIIEIKCPKSDKAVKKYIKNEKVTEKFKAQVQLQMYATGMEKCYFCVAATDFEESKNVHISLVQYDKDYVNALLNKLVLFWITNIYPILRRNSCFD